VHPGPVATDMCTGDMVAALGKAMETNPTLNNMLTSFLPTYIAEPEDIADAVCWLASDESKLTTAEALSIDQGSTKY
jgi:NAD(P)-dependent dehydrogenase (short-subunit alcohol dehydrogenase family)